MKDPMQQVVGLLSGVVAIGLVIGFVLGYAFRALW